LVDPAGNEIANLREEFNIILSVIVDGKSNESFTKFVKRNIVYETSISYKDKLNINFVKSDN